MKCSKRQ